MRELTDRQREVLTFIKRRVTDLGYPPTLAEIAGEMKLAQNAAKCHVDALAKKGAILRAPRISRGITVL